MQEACEVIEIRAPVHPANPTSDRSVRNIARAGVLTRPTCGEDSVPPDPESVGNYTVRPAYGYSGNSRLPPEVYMPDRYGHSLGRVAVARLEVCVDTGAGEEVHCGNGGGARG